MYLIALGANLPSSAGPPRATLEAAVTALGARGLTVAARSVWYRAPAYPPGSGPDFVNGAAMLETAPGSALGPAEVLAALHAVEHDLGRSRSARWEPRVCDLDLLARGGLVLPDRETALRWTQASPADQAREAPPELILPHPRLHQRGFVLVPLNDIAPGWVHPLLRRSVREMLAALPAEDRAGIVPL